MEGGQKGKLENKVNRYSDQSHQATYQGLFRNEVSHTWTHSTHLFSSLRILKSSQSCRYTCLAWHGCTFTYISLGLHN